MLPDSYRLKKRYEYKKLFQRSSRHHGPLFSIDICFDKTGLPKLGITTLTKFGNAPQRNRFKRIAREAFRRCMHLLPSGCKLNLCPRAAVKKVKMQELQSEILRMVHAAQR